MTIYFGENLKKLRKEKELTQETLAVFLGVSFQAVSKWERGETYPEITMLPAISSFFNVTIDDLLGTDKVRNEQKINEYLEIYDKMKLKNTSLTLTEFQKAVKEFPGEFSILIRYMELLMDEKDCSLYPDYEKTSKELMSIYENIQKHCTDDSIRIWSKRLICEHLIKKFQCTCNEDGNYLYYTEYLHKAESIVNELPALSDSREMLLMMLDIDRESFFKSHSNAIKELLYLLQSTIEGYCYYDKDFSSQFKIDIINNMNGLFKMIYTDGDYDKNWMHLIFNYGHLGHLYFELGDEENAIKYLRIAAEYAVELDKHPEISERIVRFYKVGKKIDEMNMCKRMTLLMKKYYPLSDEFKATTEFNEIIELMGNIDVQGIVL